MLNYNANSVVSVATASICSPTQTISNTCTAIADTGASGHYFMTTAPVYNIHGAAIPTIVSTAAGHAITLSAIAVINAPHLPLDARTGHIMPNFTNNLIGIGKICDAQCTVTFTATEVIVRDKTGNIIWQGLRETNGARMWRFNICPQSLSTTTPYATTVTP